MVVLQKSLTFLFIGIVAAFFLLYFLFSFFLASPAFATVVSDSMEPSLSYGDLAVLAKAENIKENDIIVFVKNNQALIHRVYRVLDNNSFYTKGDNNPSPDAFIVRRQDMVGKVVFVIPKAGYINLFLGAKQTG